MSLEAENQVDAVGVEEGSDVVVLTIIDSWDWSDTPRHLSGLQNKINAYFAFVETDQLFEEYPDARGKRLRIDLIARFPMSPEGLALLDRANVVGTDLDLEIEYKVR